MCRFVELYSDAGKHAGCFARSTVVVMLDESFSLVELDMARTCRISRLTLQGLQLCSVCLISLHRVPPFAVGLAAADAMHWSSIKHRQGYGCIGTKSQADIYESVGVCRERMVVQ